MIDSEQPVEAKEGLAEKAARLITRLKAYGFTHDQALIVVKITEAKVESGIWKILYNLKIALSDKKINNPKSYLRKVFENQYNIDFTDEI